MFLAPLIQDYFFGDELNFISSTLIQTISAQLFCLPISIYTFGGFSVIGIISNFLIPPTIPLAMLSCFVAAIFSPIRELSYPAKIILGLHVGIVNYLDHFNWASMSLPNSDKRIFLIYPLILIICLMLVWRTKHRFRPLYAKPQPMEKSQKDGKIYSC